MTQAQISKYWTANRIKELRERWLRLSQAEFAAEIYASVETVRKWESSGNNPNGPTLALFERLAVECGMKKAKN